MPAAALVRPPTLASHLATWVVVAVALAPGAASAEGSAMSSPAPLAAASLAEALRAARGANLELREQAAVTAEADARTRVEQAALLPRLSVSAGYTRNQHEVVIALPADGGAPREATLVPADQLEASVIVTAPLVDLAARRRIDAAAADADAQRAAAEVRAGAVDRAVVLAWYRWVAGAALAESAQVARATAADAATVIAGRLAAGTASELDASRARADLARADGDLAIATLAVTLASRELATLTGLPFDAPPPALPDGVDAEAPLEGWLGDLPALPELRAADASLRARRVAADAAALAWLPTVEAFAAERLTNAAGFGEGAAWSAGVTASWRLDLGTARAARLADAAVATGAVRAARAAQDARDRVVDAWHTVEARRAAATAAAAGADAARAGLEVARVRAGGGLATPLDLSVAQRDAFAAEVARVQAHADLAAARALLRLAAGRPVSP